MIYFVSGHRDLTQEEFKSHYIGLLRHIINDDPFAEFVVGDWLGCDSMLIEFLLSQPDYPPITIYHVDKIPRLTYGGEPLCNFENIYFTQCTTYDECDERMTRDSAFDVAWIRPGREDSHTAKNIKRRYGFNN